MKISIKRAIVHAAATFVISGSASGALDVDPQTAALMDPELLKMLPAALAAADKPPATVAQRQAKGGSLRYVEKIIPGTDGDPAVRIVIIEPRNAKRGRPGMLDMHGGGYMYGTPEGNGAFFLDALVLKLGITVVSVDYRLAPATHYPGSLHDNYAALKWFHDHAEDMGIDSKRIAIMGLSAGGGHAAALSIYARDRGEVPIPFEVLLSPMLDDRTGSTVDPGAPFGHLIWTRESNKDGWAALLGIEPGAPSVPAGSVPARVADLSGLPPTYIAVGALDLFAVEDISYAMRLMAAGVPTELHVFPGAFHGFEFLIPSAAVSRQARRTMECYISTGFGLSKGAAACD